ncbi:MAG: hypothetical protein U0350_18680 [Caldilineaceae bacterium]
MDNAGNGADAVIGPINIDKEARARNNARGSQKIPARLWLRLGSGTDALSGVASFVCSLDGAPATACVSPQFYNNLTCGNTPSGFGRHFPLAMAMQRQRITHGRRAARYRRRTIKP